MARSAKIVHLTSVHSPFDTRIFHKECRTLAQSGLETVLIAPHEQDELSCGVRIKFLPKPLNRWRRMTTTPWQVYKMALTEDALVYHFHDSELIPISLLLKLHGKLLIYDVHEDLPRQILNKDWIPSRLRKTVAKLAELVEILSTRFFDGVVAATPTIAKRFSAAKTVTVQNFPIFCQSLSEESLPYFQRAPIIAYAGGLTIMQGIEEIIAAISILSETLAPRLVLAGTFDPPELEFKMRCQPGWKRVRFLGQQQREAVMRLLFSAKVGIVIDHPIVNYLDSYSTKLFEYMAAGLPVVASNFPLWRKIIAEVDCGVLVDPLNPPAVADAIHWLLTHPKEAEAMGKRGQQAVHARYNWNNEATKLLRFYDRVTQ